MGKAEEREVGVCPGEACKVKKDGSQYSNTNSQVPQPTFWEYSRQSGNLTGKILTMFA